MENLTRYWFIIVVLIIVCIISAAAATYFALNRTLVQQNRLEINAAHSLNKIYNKLILPVHLSRMMKSDSMLGEWIDQGETPPEKALAYLKSIRDNWGVDAFIASNLTRNYYFSDGTIKKLTPDIPDVGWFFFLLKSNVEMLSDVGYHNGDLNKPFLYVDIKLPDRNNQITGYVGTAVKLEKLLVLLKTYQEQYGVSLHFVNETGMVILSSVPAIVNTRASEYNWFTPDNKDPAQQDPKAGNFSWMQDGKQWSVNKRKIDDLNWRLFMVKDLSKAGSKYYNLAINSIVFYSIFLFVMALVLILLFYRFRRDLRDAFAQIKTLRGIVPICSSCKKIRDDQGYWKQVDAYISEHSEASFSHGICPDCSDKLYGENDWYIKMKKEKGE